MQHLLDFIFIFSPPYLDFTTTMNAASPTPPQDGPHCGPPPVTVMITGPEGDPLEN